MPTLFLHIGQHKTGTKSLQRFLSINRKLLYRNGIIYPNFLGIPPCHHFARYFGFGDKTNTSEETIEVEKIIQKTKIDALTNQKDIVISSEILFSNVTIEKLSNIKDEFCDFDIKIICFLRRQDTYAESFYCQMIKMGRTYTFNEFMKNSNFDWNVNLTKYEKVFLTNNIKIIPFEFDDIDIYDKFLSLINIKTTPLYKKPLAIINRSFSKETTEIIRLLNKKLLNLRLLNRSEIINPVLFSKLVKYDANHNDKNLSNYYLTKNERTEIIEKYKNTNSTISETYGCLNPYLFKFDPVLYNDKEEHIGFNMEKTMLILIDLITSQSTEIEDLKKKNEKQ